jgi:hypothetical protein
MKIPASAFHILQELFLLTAKCKKKILINNCKQVALFKTHTRDHISCKE